VPKPEPKKDDAQQKQAKVDNTDVRNAVLAWAKAWSQKDMTRYLGAYASSFTPDKMSRPKWESDRRARIVSKKTISVQGDCAFPANLRVGQLQRQQPQDP
jgi:hypothetical protein